MTSLCLKSGPEERRGRVEQGEEDKDQGNIELAL